MNAEAMATTAHSRKPGHALRTPRRPREWNAGESDSAKLTEELRGPRPLAIARRRIQMADVADVDKATAPCARERLDAIDASQRIVCARCDDAGKRQAGARCRQPAVLLQRFERRVTGRKRRLEIGRCCEEC